MLSTLRHKGVAKKVLWFVAGIIILSFGVFGTGYNLDNGANSAGKIFGKNITLHDFQKAYMDSRDQAIITYGDRFFKSGSALNLEKEAFSRLILLTEVRKQNIKVSDEEVVTFIAQLPFFQRAGTFDKQLYESMVRNPSIFQRKPKDFEEGIRNTIAIRKMLDKSAGNISITEDELKKEYINRHEKITLDYALFNPSDFTKDAALSDGDIQKFYAENKEQFRQPAMINVQYVHLMYPDKADEAQKNKVKNAASAISHALTTQNDFTAVAKSHGQDVKESGFFSLDQPLLTFAWSPEFVEKMFAMKTGEYSSPMEAPDGWQITRIKEKKESQVPELASIAAQVKEAAAMDKAYTLAMDKADKTLKSITDGLKEKDFKSLAGTLGLKVESTTPFSRGEYINAPGLIAEFQEESFNLSAANKLSRVVRTSQGPAILYLSKIEAIDETKYGQDKEDFRNMVEAQRRNQNIAAFVNKLTLEANPQQALTNKIRYR